MLSWEPVKRGKRYCSPACGRGCTRAEYNAAMEAAKTIAAELGPKWVPHVWENLGWHYAALSPCKRMKVHGARGSFVAFIGDEERPGGEWVGHGATAVLAAVAAHNALLSDLARVQSFTTAFQTIGD